MHQSLQLQMREDFLKKGIFEPGEDFGGEVFSMSIAENHKALLRVGMEVEVNALLGVRTSTIEKIEDHTVICNGFHYSFWDVFPCRN